MPRSVLVSTDPASLLMLDNDFVKRPVITGQSMVDVHTISNIESTMWLIIDQYCKTVLGEEGGVDSSEENGGCLCIIKSNKKEALMMPTPIGYFPGKNRHDYDLESLKNAMALYKNEGLVNPNGAIRTEQVILSFYGLSDKPSNLAIVLVLATTKGWMHLEHASKIARNRKNKTFHPLYEGVVSN
jgi:hypothetical protein